jgi:hypothetical protein
MLLLSLQKQENANSCRDVTRQRPVCNFGQVGQARRVCKFPDGSGIRNCALLPKLSATTVVQRSPIESTILPADTAENAQVGRVAVV